jgi:hypothetical protein
MVHGYIRVADKGRNNAAEKVGMLELPPELCGRA